MTSTPPPLNIPSRQPSRTRIWARRGALVATVLTIVSVLWSLSDRLHLQHPLPPLASLDGKVLFDPANPDAHLTISRDRSFLAIAGNAWELTWNPAEGVIDLICVSTRRRVGVLALPRPEKVDRNEVNCVDCVAFATHYAFRSAS